MIEGNALVYVALFGWVPLVLVLFAVLPRAEPSYSPS